MGFEKRNELLRLLSLDERGELDRFLLTSGTEEVCHWLTAILTDWDALARPLSHQDQNTLLWKIGGHILYGDMWLMGEETDEMRDLLSAAKHVTLAIPVLFSPGEPMENGYFMWWDLLASNIDDLSLAGHCLGILEELCQHPDERVQYAALHGLGHLQHPARPYVVDAYIQRHPKARNDPWILQCREGTVM